MLTILSIILFLLGLTIIFQKDIKVIRSARARPDYARQKRLQIDEKANLTKLEKMIIQIDSLLAKIGKDRTHLYVVAIFFFLVGSLTGFIFFQNLLLSVTLGVAFIGITYVYLLFRTQEKSREEISNLQNAMSMITNSYMANNDIEKSIEMYVREKRENNDQTEITAFSEFVSDCMHISTNLDRNLSILAIKISNKYFDEWVKNLRLCIENKEMKFSLQPVLDAMADEKIMQIESDAKMRETWITYISVVIMTFAVIPTFRIANIDWYLILTNTFGGQFLIFLMIITAMVSSIYIAKINKPIGKM